jgi:type II secretory pathway predicted ATPase ExeA
VYLDFYGLREKPFNTTPNPRFLFLTPSHREALAQLMYGVQEGTGFAVLTGEIGTGKTTLLQALLQRMDPQTGVAMIVNPMLGFDGVLELILEDLGVGKGGDTTAQRLVSLHRHLLERVAAGQRTVVIIDEAQHLEPATLEQIRLLSNYESPSQKLLQIILAGQPELEDKLALPQLRQLRQRIGLRCVIQPLTPRETRDYVTGYADQIRQIDHRVVKEAIRTIEAHEHSAARWRMRRWKPYLAGQRWLLGAGVAAVVSTVGGAVWYTRGASAVGDVVSTYGARVLSGVEALLRP